MLACLFSHSLSGFLIGWALQPGTADVSPAAELLGSSEYPGLHTVLLSNAAPCCIVLQHVPLVNSAGLFMVIVLVLPWH